MINVLSPTYLNENAILRNEKMVFTWRKLLLTMCMSLELKITLLLVLFAEIFFHLNCIFKLV